MEMNVSFLGAAQNVTGSRFLLEVNHSRILVDCGLYQERDFIERNWDHFPVPANTIDAVLLTHAHLDHSGWLPRLVKKGFQGKIICTNATMEITKIVLRDAAHIQEEDAAFKQKRHKKEGREGPFPVEPLYTIEDAEDCDPLFKPIRYNQPIPVTEGITATFQDAGHILGAAAIRLEVQIDGETRTLLFSGDVGRWDKPILQDPDLFDQADYVFLESTYGDRIHQKSADVKDTLAEIINTTRKAGGNIVVPSFAIERAQEILYYLNELLIEDRIPHLLTFLDSPMAVGVTKVFQNHPEMFDEDMLERMKQHKSLFEYPGLTLSEKTSQSKAINHITGTVMIIAGSGMCNGGRIKHHLVNNIARPESTILFVGYQAVGTLGRQILQKPDEVRILGQKYPIKARIEQITGFSGHADRDELIRWASAIQNKPRQAFIIHGESNSANHFAEFLKQKLQWPTLVPEYMQTITIS